MNSIEDLSLQATRASSFLLTFTDLCFKISHVLILQSY